VRSFKTAVAHRNTKKRTDAPPLRHEDCEDHEETIVSNEGTIVTDAPPLRHEERRTSVASRTSVATQTATTKGRTSIASRRNDCYRRTSFASRNDAPPLRHENTKRNDAPPLRHETKRTNVQTKRRLHLHCNATNTNPRIVTNATNNDEDR